MASSGFGFRARRLDATEQPVVYCHVCSNEWLRSERESIQCPRCDSDVTEIIEPDSDPRDDDFGDLFPRGFPGHRRGSDSDPEEFDVEDHDPGLNRPAFPTGTRMFDRRGDPARPPVGGEDIILRFADMLHQMGAPGARRNPSDGSSRDGADFSRNDRGANDSPFLGSRIHRTTIRSGPFGGGITITSSTFGDTTGADRDPADFDRIFGGLMGGPPAPPTPGERQNRAPGLPGFAALLQEIIGATINPASAVHGDAVYTQEALDRIVSTLMEAHPQSNAAPPATETAIQQLEKKKLTDEMIGSEGKAECTICIDEMHQGDEVTVLPCTHWFHGECVTLWLKEHNTCPICRRPIETTSERRERRATATRSNSDPLSSARQSQSAAGSQSGFPAVFSPGNRSPTLRGIRMEYVSPFSDRQDHGQEGSAQNNNNPYSRTFIHMSSNSNPGTPDPPLPVNIPGGFPSFAEDLFREREWQSEQQRTRERDRERQREQEHDRERDRDRDRDQGTSTSSNRFSIFGDGSSTRSRDFSGGQSRDGGRGNSNGQGNSSGSGSGSSNSHNPLAWFRNHLSGGRNSGGGSSSNSDNRDRERRWRS
ncbi:hypothetical protein V8F20_007382 [Naviculisporaceae sp. PSN 640]